MPIVDADWLKRAERAAAALGAETRGQPGARHQVYVVLLHRPAHPAPWGLYVGQTALDPDLRFDQHKNGYKASRAVRRFGVKLLPELVAHLNPLAGWESLELEAALFEIFQGAGIGWVEGGH